MYEIKTEDIYEDFSRDKNMFHFSNYSTKWEYYDDSNKIVIRKMEDETSGVAVEEFVRLNPSMYLFSIDNNSEHKKAKGLKCCCNNKS